MFVVHFNGWPRAKTYPSWLAPRCAPSASPSDANAATRARARARSTTSSGVSPGGEEQSGPIYAQFETQN
jgi:hypothetical protein